MRRNPFPRTSGARRCVAVAGMLLLSTAAGATTLVETVEAGVRNNLLLRAQTATTAAEREDAAEAAATLMPQLQLSGSPARTRGNISFFGQGQVERTFSSAVWALKLTQPLLRPASALASQEARDKVTVAEWETRDALQQAMLEAAQSYFDAAGAASALAAAEASGTESSARLESIRLASGIGNATAIEVEQAKLALVDAADNADAARATLREKTYALQTLLHAPAGAIVALDDGGTELPQSDHRALGDWTSCSAQAPDVHAKASALAQSDDEVKVQIAQYWPTLDLTVTRSKDRQGGNLDLPIDDNTKTTSTTLGLQLTVPLYSGGATPARVRAAEQRRLQAEADLEHAREVARTRTVSAWLALQRDEEQLTRLKDAVGAAQALERDVEEAFRAGRKLRADVLASARSLSELRARVRKARYDGLQQQIRLRASCGELVADDFANVSGWLASRGSAQALPALPLEPEPTRP